MRERIEDAYKEAMKNGDKKRVSTLRLIRAAIKDREIAQRSSGKTDEVSQDEIMGLLARMISQREDSIRDYKKAKREDLVKQEEEECTIIRSFLPEPMKDEQLEAACLETMRNMDAKSIKDMGPIMAFLKREFAGRMDFAKAATILRAHLK